MHFTAALDLAKGAGRCNCTVCTKLGLVGVIVRPEAVVLTAGEQDLQSYVRGPISTRYFCKTCGTHVFGRGHHAHMGGDYASVNINTLDDVDPNTLSLIHWDGRHDNWQAGPPPEPWPIFV